MNGMRKLEDWNIFGMTGKISVDIKSNRSISNTTIIIIKI